MDLSRFLLHTAKLEHDAEQVYRRGIEILDAEKDVDVIAFFEDMAEYCHLHLRGMMARAGLGELPSPPETGYEWDERRAVAVAEPDGLPPESSGINDLDGAMLMALHNELRAIAFYEGITHSPSSDEEVKKLATVFVAEEYEHIQAIERFLGLRPY